MGDFGQWVRETRTGLLLTQEELAERAGVSIRTVHRLESGHGGAPRPATRRQITAALDRAQPPPGTAAATAAPGPVPAQLPLDVSAFTGRAGELRDLDDRLARAVADPGTQPRVVVLTGAPGVGKTALAVHWAHRVAHRFPDGQLHLDLHGYDLERPVEPAEALAELLRALNAEPRDLTSARYRTLLAGRRMLILLDNARAVEQVRPLLPGGRSCFVLVTSRDSLAGLVARDGAARVTLAEFTDEEAAGLLRATIGPRADTDGAAVTLLAERCARLPLALRIAAERAAAAPGASLRSLADELADERRLLDLLDAGDPRSAVRAVFSWSFRELPAAAIELFDLLGLHPGRDTEPEAAAALCATAVPAARAALAELARAQLLTRPGAGRYGAHDLLRVYAAERAAALPEPIRRAALTRLLDHYLAGAAAAMDALYPHERDRRPARPDGVTPPRIEDAEQARAWLAAEVPNLMAAGAAAAAGGWTGHAAGLATTLRRYLDLAGYWAEALTLHSRVLAASRRDGDRPGEADAMHMLGVLHWRLGQLDDALHAFHNTLAIRRETGDRAGQATAHNNLGGVYVQRGEYDAFFEHIHRAVTLHRATGNRPGAAACVGNLGLVCVQLGRYADADRYLHEAAAELRTVGDDSGLANVLEEMAGVHLRLARYPEAERCLTESRTLTRRVGDRLTEANALTGLGSLRTATGRYEEAVTLHREALASYEEIGDRAGTADALDNLGVALRHRGRLPEAVRCHRQARTIIDEIGDRRRAPKVLNGLAEALRATGHHAEALTHHRRAIELAVASGNRIEHPRALCGIAETLEATTGPAAARPVWAEALALYDALGTPDATAVRARLDPA
ncbi:ATP-binding protein [Dactylosporangium sp. NPDC051541]|uniref:ATP-binding protein n=1 Tax=Dactylosporangium sp. NPDC051541 TaxID=3363977 RepID=UPI00379095BD